MPPFIKGVTDAIGAANNIGREHEAVPELVCDERGTHEADEEANEDVIPDCVHEGAGGHPDGTEQHQRALYVHWARALQEPSQHYPHEDGPRNTG